MSLLYFYELDINIQFISRKKLLGLKLRTVRIPKLLYFPLDISVLDHIKKHVTANDQTLPQDAPHREGDDSCSSRLVRRVDLDLVCVDIW